MTNVADIAKNGSGASEDCAVSELKSWKLAFGAFNFIGLEYNPLILRDQVVIEFDASFPEGHSDRFSTGPHLVKVV